MKFADRRKMFKDEGLNNLVDKVEELRELHSRKEKGLLEKRDITNTNKDIKRLTEEITKLRKEG